MWSREKLSRVMNAKGVAVVTEMDKEGQGLRKGVG
jgi:5S rRNA maturation endonuclease (ribonuclease M5)